VDDNYFDITRTAADRFPQQFPKKGPIDRGKANSRPEARVVPARDEKPWVVVRGRGELQGDPFASIIDEADSEAGRPPPRHA